MGKLVIQLKQHSPILHFQSQQHGATLRATEVKPKLDKFILTKIGRGEYHDGKDKASKKQWLIVSAPNNTALNYKMRFNIIEESKQWNNKSLIIGDNPPESYAPFFGNLGDDTHPKELVFYPKVELVIFSLIPEVIDEIKKYICEFFAYTNFGTRQSKGFGSFYVAEDDKVYKPIDDFLQKTTALQSFFQSTQKDLFDDIDLFYKSIRSGVFPFKSRNYVASALNTYLFFSRRQWDKTTIRNVIDGNTNGAQGEKLYRDLLGLATLCNYGHKGGIISKQISNIERFKSPIFIKPISTVDNVYHVFIGYFEIPDDENIINKEVEIEGTNIDIKGVVNKNFKFSISTPSIQEFNLTEYMNFVFTDFDISKCIKKKNPNIPHRIETIYQELKSNFQKINRDE